MYYVVVDIGCIECGEPTNILGIFTDKDKALGILTHFSSLQAAHWHGQHSFELFECEELDKVYPVDYESD